MEPALLKALATTYSLFAKIDAKKDGYLSSQTVTKQQQIEAQIEKGTKLPELVEKARIIEIKKMIEVEFEGKMLDAAERDRIIALTYNAIDTIDKNPELYRVDLAKTGSG